MRALPSSPSDSIVARCKEILEPTGRLPHYNGSLLDHLIGTWRILTSGGAEPEVALAGLIHSIYSTEHYLRAAVHLSERAMVQSVVGTRAEWLAYLFCTLQKEPLWDQLGELETISVKSREDGAELELQHVDVADLLAIECANFIDQCSTTSGSPRPFMAWYIRLARAGHVRLSRRILKEAESFCEEQEEESIDLLNGFLKRQSSSGKNIERASVLNPFSAELQILSALISPKSESSKRHRSFKRARVLLQSWGTTWDKRLPFEKWLEITKQDIDTLTGAARENLLASVLDALATQKSSSQPTSGS